MIKFVTLRILRGRIKNTLPKVNKILYKKLFSLSYRFFIYLKPSQIWVIILALLNKTEFSKLLGIPSIFILFSTLFSESESFDPKNKLDQNILNAKLITNNLNDPDNKWDSFFWTLITLALITRFIKGFFKLMWIPFKIALIYFTLKYFGFDFTNVYNILNNLSLGVIDWFYQNINKFFKLFFNNKNNDK